MTTCRIIFLSVALTVCSACVTNREYAQFDTDRDLQPSDIFYVEQPEDDRRELGQLIAENLSERGLRATAGPEAGMPDNTTIVVTYVDDWAWDITMFLLEMMITFQDATSGEVFATASSYHSSMNRLKPVEMIDEIISNMFEADNDPDGLIEFAESRAL